MKIAIITDGTLSADIRLVAYKPYLEAAGHNVVVMEAAQAQAEKRIPIVDLALLARPNCYPIIEEYKSRGIRTIADMDDDFWSIPKSHVGYDFVGPGNQRYIHEMEESLSNVDHITVSTEVMASRMTRFGRPISIIHNGWDDTNKYWYAPKKSLPKKIIIGWAGTITHREDFQQAINGLVYVTKKYPDVGILIGCDIEIYKMLRKIPESSRWFVPMFPYQMYPLIFRYIDIWIAPLNNSKFNEAKSDIKLVEGSVRKLPSVVSPVPAYVAWNNGTLFARDEQEWCKQLEALIESTDLRKSLGEQQHSIAEKRAMSLLAKEWINLVA